MQGKVEICGVNTSRLKTLSQAEMNRLLRLARAGDEQARQTLIEGNLRLVLSVIQRFDKRGESPDDLFQVGCIGLIKAISNFDPDKQVRFSTYGVPMIVLCRNTEIGVSTMTRKQALHKAVEVLAQTQGNEEAIRILEELSSELPIIHWSDSSIRDCVEQFMVDYGRFPKATDFKRAGMPPHPVIANKYGMPVKKWLETNYPQHAPSREELIERYTQAFIEDYYRIKPRSGDEFNAKRADKSRGWRSIAKYYHLGTWRNLVKHLGLPQYFDMKRDHVPVKFKVNVQVDEEFLQAAAQSSRRV